LTFLFHFVIIQSSEFNATFSESKKEIYIIKIMELKKTPLHEVHKKLGARIVGFAGWEMPLKYTGEIEEHRAVRSSCGLFDVSHMGEVEVSGPGALDAVQRLTTNDASILTDGQCQYTLILNPGGGIVDDCIVYRFSSESFLFCVNAANTEKVFEWISAHCSGVLTSEVGVEDRSASIAQLALQGPESAKVIESLATPEISAVRHFHFVTTNVCGVEAVISRTGYTGEDGFELYVDSDNAEVLWQAIMDAGSTLGLLPSGLAARDSLRLEMGYPLYGNELGEDTTPIEAGLKNFVNLDKDFIGKEALERKRVGRSLVGFEMAGQGIARPHYKILKDGKIVGEVTSGSFSPTLKRAIGLGYADSRLTRPGTAIDIEIRKRVVKAVIVETPFYHRVAPAAVV
jgi:aminomethyltransferase